LGVARPNTGAATAQGWFGERGLRPPAPGSEIILESTAHGVGNFFHQAWRDAENGVSNYIAIFVPWFWQEEYRAPVPENFALDEEERDYAALHGLDHEQMAWRRTKTAELKDPNLFKQEYPANAAEAFQMSGHDSFIPPELIARARKASCEPSGPLVIGYDPAWLGPDRHAMAWRQGRRLLKVETRVKLAGCSNTRTRVRADIRCLGLALTTSKRARGRRRLKEAHPPPRLFVTKND
jgi:hypothetical protein